MKKKTFERFEARGSEAGFTLTEVLLTMAILAVLSSPLLVVFKQSQSSFLAQTSQSQLSQQMRVAMDQISRTIRQAANEPYAAVGNAVQLVGSGHLQLRTDITGSVAAESGSALDATGDPDGAVSALFEQVSYRHDAGGRRIMVDIGNGEAVLVENITSLSFSTFDLSGNPTTAPDNIARVQVTMVGETATADLEMHQKYALTLQSEVFIRNRAPQVVPEGGTP